MVFSSLLFLFRFLPLVLGIYFLAPKRWRNLVLFIASLIFYAWGEPVYILLILFSTVVDYTAGPLMVPGETVIIFDEIQSCEMAFSALKPLVLEGSYVYIASGSLLGVDLSDKFRSPMGYLKIVDIHPMDFEEFLWANGIGRKQTDNIRRHIDSKTPFTDFQLDRLLELFLRYLAIGGMLEAVSTFVEKKNYSDVTKIFEDLLTILRKDAMRYSPKSDRMRISACLDSIDSGTHQ